MHKRDIQNTLARAKGPTCYTASNALSHAIDHKKTSRKALPQQYLDMLTHCQKIAKSIDKAIKAGDTVKEARLKSLLKVHVSRMQAIGHGLERKGVYIAG